MVPPKSKIATKGRPKAIKKSQAQKNKNPEAKQNRAFKSLCAQIDGGHFKNALKTCDAILRLSPQDPDALRVKLFLLLQTEQYDLALNLIGSLGTSSSYTFEKAYALYGCHREEDARAEVERASKESQGSGSDRGLSLLEAQLDYRQHNYQEAFDKYSRLLDSCPSRSEEYADLSTNLNASQTHLDFLSHGYLASLDGIPSSVIDNIEETPPPAPPSTSLIHNNARFASSPPTQSKATVKKSVRWPRVPKGVTPGVSPPPDPERWIKKSERTNYGQGSGKRKKYGGGATQGASVDHHTSQSAKGAKNKKRN